MLERGQIDLTLLLLLTVLIYYMKPQRSQYNIHESKFTSYHPCLWHGSTYFPAEWTSIMEIEFCYHYTGTWDVFIIERFVNKLTVARVILLLTSAACMMS